jgi:hypothetical protein
MTKHDQDAVVQRFAATGGRFSGILGLITVAVVLVLAAMARDAGTPLGVAILAALGGVLFWAAFLRPALWVTASQHLVLRGMFHTDRVPLAAIDKVAVGQVLTVTVAERRLSCPAVGYTVRQIVRDRSRTPSMAAEPVSAAPHEARRPQAFVEARIQHLAQEARDLSGVRKGSPEQAELAAQVRRTWAWPELTALVLLAVAFVGWLLA